MLYLIIEGEICHLCLGLGQVNVVATMDFKPYTNTVCCAFCGGKGYIGKLVSLEEVIDKLRRD